MNRRDESGRTILHMAIANQVDPEVIGFLIDKGVNVNDVMYNRSTPMIYLLYAIRTGAGIGIIQMLLDKGALPNLEGDVPPALGEACKNSDLEIVRLLLDRGANVNAIHYTAALHEACDNVRPEVCTLLLDRGADINAKETLWGRTPLHVVLWADGWRRMSQELVKILIERGADLEAKDDRGDTVLHLACEGSSIPAHELAVKMILEKKVSPNITNALGETPLHIAARNHNTATIHQLLEAGASVWAVTKDGSSPLHYVCNGGPHTSEAIRVLVNAGADRDWVDNKRRKAESYIDEYAWKDVKDLFPL